jgi:hypothetical protein
MKRSKHWRHWDRQGPDREKDRIPPNCFKPGYGPKSKQSETDPSGDAPEWMPPFLPFMPIDPVVPRIPFPGGFFSCANLVNRTHNMDINEK